MTLMNAENKTFSYQQILYKYDARHGTRPNSEHKKQIIIKMCVCDASALSNVRPRKSIR